MLITPSIKKNIMAKLYNLNAAGIDISTKEYVVAVPEDRCKDYVRTYGTFTKDIHLLAKWLIDCKIETVAMESTGVYWYHLYTVLLDYGFEVYLVNAQHVKNVPGRKSDVEDAQWIQELHTDGLLRASFQPDNLTRSLRNYVRLRKNIVQQMTTEIQRMQKALEQMNIKLNNVIRDITGKTGFAIISAILQGERDIDKLSELRDWRIKATKETVKNSLEGNWREEQIFNLQIAYNHYHFLQRQLGQCDAQSQKVLENIAQENQHKTRKKPKPTLNKNKKNKINFNAKDYLCRTVGVDVTNIHGIQEITALTILSETGANLKEKFPTEKQFLKWLNVVPDNKITGGKVISSKVRKKKNRAGQAFRDAASSQWKAQNPIGDYLRGKKSKSGGKQAVVATARKLASIYYKMVTEKEEFDTDILKRNSEYFLKTKLKQVIKLKNRLENSLNYQDICV
jgi:transposase